MLHHKNNGPYKFFPWLFCKWYISLLSGLVLLATCLKFYSKLGNEFIITIQQYKIPVAIAQ